MSDRTTGRAPSRVTAVLGPTNTGKTHLAVERMAAHASGMIGLPLRLLAREIYDRLVRLKGANAVALITGEEKILPARAAYFVCTVEAMPLERTVEFLAVDEIQLCADPARGHVFTHRLLHARGREETMFLGAATMAPLVRRLLPEAEIVGRDRLSVLSYAGPRKLTRLPRRSAVVAFSAEAVYAIAELIRRQRGGAAVVMGSLSPRTRNAQVALYQSGEVDFLVATDAIGMGLNMDVDHVAFAGLRKFDGKRTRWLTPPEVAQVAGRAGRFTRDGTFGVTGECEEMDEDLVRAVEDHAFEPVPAAEWRNGALDFASLAELLRSLGRAPERPGLKLAEEALDETVLRRLAAEPDVAAAARDRGRLLKLWDACQIPDFRKTTLDEHQRLVREVFEALGSRAGRLSEDWIAPQFAALDSTGGEIDALAGRLAGVRTLAYVSHRSGWLARAEHWREATRALEARLSDALHEKLMARFIDRRTSVLMRALHVREEVLAGVAEDGSVTVEGQAVGRLRGLDFRPERGGTALEDRALRAAARRAVGPEIARRLGRLAAAADGDFAVQPDGIVTWEGAAAAAVLGDSRPFAPRVRLLGELGPEPARERAARRIEAWLAGEAGRRLAALQRLEAAMASGELKGLPRGLAWRLAEAGGVLPRPEVEAELAALSQQERRALRALGVTIGAHSVWLPAALSRRARALAAAFTAGEGGGWRPPAERLSPLPDPAPSARALAARGLRAVGRWAAPVAQLEQMAEALRAGPRGAPLDPATLAALGWTEAQGREIRNALKAARPGRPPKPARVRPESPFAALAALKPQPAPARRRRPRRRPAARKAAP